MDVMELTCIICSYILALEVEIVTLTEADSNLDTKLNSGIREELLRVSYAII